jgi:hypothetical protein
MGDPSKCPSCGVPLSVPNPPKCWGCAGALEAGSRSGAQALEAPAPSTAEPLLAIVTQPDGSDEDVSILAEVAKKLSGFERRSWPELVSEAQLGLPACALEGPGRPDVPKPTLHEMISLRGELGSAAERKERLFKLTQVARWIAQARLTRALVVMTSGLTWGPRAFIEASDDIDGALLVWTGVLQDAGCFRTLGMEAFDLPNVSVDAPTGADVRQLQLLLTGARIEMLSSLKPLADGSTFPGPPPEAQSFSVSSQGNLIHLRPTPSRPWYRRMFGG